ncbi:MAG: hypothetical protein IPI69_15740 [Bacteroidales bacterium]|nr:hypothetical protein [Bacteroidales bacterium]
MVSIRDLPDDYYEYDGENYCIRGKSTGKLYTLGDRVEVEIDESRLAEAAGLQVRVGVQGAEHRAQGTGHRAQGTGHECTEHRARGTGLETQAQGTGAQGTGHRAQR